MPEASQRIEVKVKLSKKLNGTLVDLAFELETDTDTIVGEALAAYLPRLEERLKIIKEHEYPRPIKS